MKRQPALREPSSSLPRNLFLVLVGAFVFLLPLKFGNPIVLESLTTLPAGIWDWVYSMWPNQLALVVALILVAWGFWVDRSGPKIPSRAVWLPCIFLVTQAASACRSVTPQLSLDTLVLFAAGLGMYASGLRHFSGRRETGLLVAVLLVSTLIVSMVAISQYFGGLEETRRYFQLYYAGQDVSSDYLIKLRGDRPFGTFVYPNSLAGFLVLMLPVLVARLWLLRNTWEPAAMWVVIVAVTGLVMFTLVLCGSKGGFLALVVVVAVAAYGVRMPRGIKIALVVLIVGCGCGLVVRYGSDFMRYGLSTSSARIDYWRAGLRVFADHPWIGTGPGTFGSVYPRYKSFTSEDPRLAHNDFLEALSDTGVFGFLAYAALWLWPLCIAVRRMRQTTDPMTIGLTLGLVAWVFHGLIDFDQYIPSIALLAFFFLGALENRLAEPVEAVPGVVWQKLCGTVLALLLCLLSIDRWAGQYCFDQSKELVSSNRYAAKKSIDRAIACTPLDAFYHAESARVEVQLGHPDRAFVLLKRAHDLDAYRSGYVWEAARLHRELEGPSTAYFAAAEQAIALSPKNTRYRRIIAKDYELVGQPQKAEEHLKALAEIGQGRE